MKVRRHPNSKLEEFTTTDEKRMSELFPEIKPGVTDFLDLSLSRIAERKSSLSIQFDRDDLHHIGNGLIDYYRSVIDEYEKQISELYTSLEIIEYLDPNQSRRRYWNKFVREKYLGIKENKDITNLLPNYYEVLRKEVNVFPYKIGLRLLRGAFKYFDNCRYEKELINILIELPSLKGLLYLDSEVKIIEGNEIDNDTIKLNYQGEVREYFLETLFDMINDSKLYSRDFIKKNVSGKDVTPDELLSLIAQFALSLPDEYCIYNERFLEEEE